MNAVDYAEQIPGWMTRRELLWLCDIAANSTSYTEIGVYCGRSFAAVALSLPQGALLQAVDITLGEQRVDGITFGDVLNHVSNQRPDLKLILVKDSAELAASYLRNTDVAFIDAGHKYEDTVAEIAAWRPKCHTLCGHDWNPTSWPGVVQAAQEAGGRQVAGSIWTL